MSKVVLLAINAKYVHSSLSVWVIASGVSKYAKLPHEVNVVEATINMNAAEIVEVTAKYNPDVIGISTYIWNSGMLHGLLKLLRERLPNALLVLGGPEASYNAEYWLINAADYVLAGEGEYVFPPFLDRIAEGKPATADTSTNQLIPDSPVDPYTDIYFSALGNKLSYIEASRGCPFRCSFCLSAGSSVKFFPLDAVKEQILKLSQSETHTIKFVDRTFNCNTDRAYELFEYIIGLDTVCRFHFEAAADLFDDHTISLLAASPPGRIQFEIGLQSFHEPALRASFRQTCLKKAERNIKALLANQNIHIHVDLIAGLPYETLADFENSFNRAYSLSAHVLQLGFLKLLHGSVLREQAEQLGIQYSAKPPYEIIRSPWLSDGDVQCLKLTENALQHTYNKGRFLSTLDYVLKTSDVSPFSLMHAFGASIPNHGLQLEAYTVQIYDYLKELSGVDCNALQDCMVYDLLGMVKGKNMPSFLKNDVPERMHVGEKADRSLGHKVRREEYAVLHSGNGIFVDRNNKDPVTGLYKVQILWK